MNFAVTKSASSECMDMGASYQRLLQAVLQSFYLNITRCTSVVLTGIHNFVTVA